MLTLDALMRYWNSSEVELNLLVFANIFGALILGLLVGYERTYHGRAAGMRTYGLVCMAACALTVLVGYPEHWFGGNPGGVLATRTQPDLTHVIQGIVTGVGFLGAGLIMKDGMSISGLTSAASIWASSAIGILVGIGFYFSAILLAALSAALMMWAARLERALPARPAIAISIRFKAGVSPQREIVNRVAHEHGYKVAGGSFSVRYHDGRHTWRYVAIEVPGRKAQSLLKIAEAFAAIGDVEDFEISHARN